MDGINVNGGNADGAREDPNLEAGSVPNLQETQVKVDTPKMDGQDVNGDIRNSPKKGMEINVRRKLRKFKANSTSTIESDSTLNTKGRKRKLSEPDDLSSEESMEFNGFDIQADNEVEPASHVLKKLIGIGNYCYGLFKMQAYMLASKCHIMRAKDCANDLLHKYCMSTFCKIWLFIYSR